MKRILIAIIVVLFTSCSDRANNITVYLDNDLKETLNYSLVRLKDRLREKGKTVTFLEEPDNARFVVRLKELNSDDDDGFSLEKSEKKYTLSAKSSRGLLYGILDVAEQLKKGKSWEEIDSKEIEAHYSFRAIKFNLPWFSYRSGENLSLHYDTCKDLKFWETFLDMMVENKFNVLSLWNLHPYMYMVRSEKFPEAAPFTDQEMAEWESFWKSIFKMAKERGIEPYIFNWNIFVSEEFSKAYKVAGYSKDSGFFGEGETNQIIEDYTREMVSKTIDTYEDISGIGITLGERMGGMTSEMRRDWIDRTMIEGIRQAQRKVRLFYRAPLSAGLTSHGTVSKATEVITREAIENIGLEEDVLLDVPLAASVIATGGSAVYSERGMARLAQGSTLVYLEVPLSVVETRIGDFSERGIAKPDNQTIEDVFDERTA
ncbi:MAG: shikimate kinase, partial [Bacteroidota bacterium]